MVERPLHILTSYLVLRRGEEVALLLRQNTGYEDGNYSLIAGHVDPAETFWQCIVREAMEEAALEVSYDKVSHVYTMHRDTGAEVHNRVDMFFVVEDLSQEPVNQEPEKCGGIHWYPLTEL